MILPIVHVSVGLVMDENRQVLLTQRPQGKIFAGLWEFPGGKRDVGETSRQALVRELKEELDVDIILEETKFLGHARHVYPDFMFWGHCFACFQWEGSVRPLEGQKIAWIALETLLTNKERGEEGTNNVTLDGYPLLPGCKAILTLFTAKKSETIKDS